MLFEIGRFMVFVSHNEVYNMIPLVYLEATSEQL